MSLNKLKIIKQYNMLQSFNGTMNFFKEFGWRHELASPADVESFHTCSYYFTCYASLIKLL